jgi:predicted AAA+ superfamily ATPase
VEYVQENHAKADRKNLKTFPVLLLTGPRQVGKTFLMESLAGKTGAM